MDSEMPRRRVLLGAVGLAGALAGCSALSDDPPGGETDTVTPAPVPEADVDPTSIEAVGSLVGVGPLSMVVTGVDRTDRATILGREVDPGSDRELLVLDVSFKNASNEYVAAVVDRFDVATTGGYYESIEPFAAFTTTPFGGWTIMPGELRRVRLHYPIPRGSERVELHVGMRIRLLPDEFEVEPPIVVDLTSSVSSPMILRQTLRVPIHDLGRTVTTRGLTVDVLRVTAPVDLRNWDPPAGHEHLGVTLAVRGGSDLGRPVVVGVGGFGGMTLADDRGREFTTTRWFPGTVGGSAYYDPARAIGPGETNEGTTVVEVPTDLSPLYLVWTPPAELWAPETGEPVNRHVWRLR